MNARTLLVLLLATATGCLVDDYGTVTITAACFPPAPDTSGTCTYPSSCSATMLGNTWVDATYAPTRGTLVWPFQVDNLRPDNKSAEGGTTTSTAYVTGYKLSYASSAVSVPDVTLDSTSTTIPPVGNTVMLIQVVPANVATLLAALPAAPPPQVRVDVRVKGHFGDGSSFEAGPFSMVVDVRNGAGAGVACPVATPTLVGVCPQPGQSGVPLCQ
jgi:hypothetical protein